MHFGLALTLRVSIYAFVYFRWIRGDAIKKIRTFSFHNRILDESIAVCSLRNIHCQWNAFRATAYFPSENISHDKMSSVFVPGKHFYTNSHLFKPKIKIMESLFLFAKHNTTKLFSLAMKNGLFSVKLFSHSQKKMKWFFSGFNL